MNLAQENHFVTGEEIKPEEIVDLYAPIDWGSDRTAEVWKNDIALSLATVGIKNSLDKLVAVGLLIGTQDLALISELIVHPSHRGQGLGSALVEERVRIADEKNIPVLITYLTPSNPIRAYRDLGFIPNEQQPGGLIRIKPQN